MHKDKLKVCFICFILLVAVVMCVVKHNQFLKMKNKEFRFREGYSDLEKIKANISGLNFGMVQKNILCFSKITDIKDTIKKISESYRIQDVLFKEFSCENEYFWMEDIELKFLSKKEKYVYIFINELMNIPNVLVHFCDIKIVKGEKGILETSIKCKLFSIKKHRNSKFISWNIVNDKSESNGSFKMIRLFSNTDFTPQYTLHCVLDKMAFINNVWMNIGDENDDFSIKDVDYSHIFIEKDKKIIRIKTGEVW